MTPTSRPAGPAAPNLLANLDLPRVPQQARSRQKRDAVLEAAVRLFQQRGYDTTTADDIAAEAQVSIGTFYSYFRNKRQVFLTLYNDCIQSIFELGIATLDFGDNPRAAIRATVDRAMRRDRLFYGLRHVWAELLTRDAEIAGFNQQFNQAIYAQILAAVRRVAAQGQTRPDLDIESTSWLITMLIDQAWQREPGPDDAPEHEIQRLHDALADLIFHTIFRG